MGNQGRPENLREYVARRISTSMASFIAEVDGSSSDVAAYIEQRLAPLWDLLYDPRIGPALERIAHDSRRLVCKTCLGDGQVVNQQSGVVDVTCPNCKGRSLGSGQ